MKSVKNFGKGIRAKDYDCVTFEGPNTRKHREEWIEQNPDVIIINTHIFIKDNTLYQVIEFIK